VEEFIVFLTQEKIGRQCDGDHYRKSEGNEYWRYFPLLAKMWRSGSRHGAEDIRVAEEALYTGTELALDYWCAKDWLMLQLGKSWALDELERERQVYSAAAKFSRTSN
jgi:hypothetical protein